MSFTCVRASAIWAMLGAFVLIGAPRPVHAQCQRAKLIDPTGHSGDIFGFSVAVDGNTIMVGAPWDNDRGNNIGLVFVYERIGPQWFLAQTLPDPICPDLDGFGWCVDLEADTAVIGVRIMQEAHIFERLDAQWQQRSALIPDDWWFGNFYGESAALADNRAVVGAPYDDENGYRSGSAYIFERDPNGAWIQAAKLLANDGEPYNKLGASVDIDGDVAVGGARDDDDLGNYSGSAYVFERDPNGTWFQAAKLLPHDGSVFWSFGEAVAVSGDRVLVGATTAHAFAPSAGAAYIFERQTNGDWIEVAQIVSDDIENSDAFGIAVGLEGDLALIGAKNADYNDIGSGAAYVFVRQPNDHWVQVAKIGASDGAFDDRFGSSLGLSGSTAIIGAYYNDEMGEDAGAAYVFAVGPDADGNGIMDVCECIGDLDSDYDVDLSDLAQLLANYGEPSGMSYEDGDLDNDGDVDLADLAELLSRYGDECW